MIINKLLLLCIVSLGALGLKAQNSIVSSGGDASGSGGSASYSIGQVLYKSVSSSSGSVNQGIQQPYVLNVSGINNHPDINFSINVYPNPSVDNVTLNIGKQEQKNMSFQLLDTQGKLILNHEITTIESTIKMDGYIAGIYFLKVMNNNSEITTFKIIKN